MELESQNTKHAHNPRTLISMQSQITDSKGDVPALVGIDAIRSDLEAGSISRRSRSRRVRKARDLDDAIGHRRRIDDYDYYIHPQKDTLGWNSLIDEGCKAWQAVFSEFLGVLVLVFVGCGSCVNWGKIGEPNFVQIAFAFGMACTTVCTVIGHISGAHVNPAVTIGLCVGGKIKPAKALFYIVFQVLGAIAGAVLLDVVVPEYLMDGLGQTIPNPHITQWQAIMVEAIITFLLTLTVFSVYDELRRDIKGSAPLMVGFVIMSCHLMALPFTGSSMNPARSTGPAIAKNNFEHLWIYWVGPTLGGIVAGIFHISLFHKEEEDALKNLISNIQATGPKPDPSSIQWNGLSPSGATPIGTGTNTASDQSVI